MTKADGVRGEAQSNSSSPSYKQSELDRALQREIASLWQSDEVSRQKPTPQNEAERGTLVVESVLWEALPSFLRKLNATLESTLGPDKTLPLSSAPIIFSSWMGGDRDGNPNVTPETTREVCLKQRAQAAGLLSRDLSRLERELSITECSDEMRSVVGEDAREPYRSILQPVRKRHIIIWSSSTLFFSRFGGTALCFLFCFGKETKLMNNFLFRPLFSSPLDDPKIEQHESLGGRTIGISRGSQGRYRHDIHGQGRANGRITTYSSVLV